MEERILDAVAARYPHTVERCGDELIDLDNNASFRPVSVRDALGWINAGEFDNDGTNPVTTRLGRWFHKRGSHLYALVRADVKANRAQVKD